MKKQVTFNLINNMSWKKREVPTYKKEVILQAIKDEGLVDYAWGYKNDACIWVFTDGMEKHEIWDKLPTPLHGFEIAHWDGKLIDDVTYFLLDNYEHPDYFEKVYYRAPWEFIIDWYWDIYAWWHVKKYEWKRKHNKQ